MSFRCFGAVFFPVFHGRRRQAEVGVECYFRKVALEAHTDDRQVVYRMVESELQLAAHAGYVHRPLRPGNGAFRELAGYIEPLVFVEAFYRGGNIIKRGECSVGAIAERRVSLPASVVHERRTYAIQQASVTFHNMANMLSDTAPVEQAQRLGINGFVEAFEQAGDLGSKKDCSLFGVHNKCVFELMGQKSAGCSRRKFTWVTIGKKSSGKFVLFLYKNSGKMYERLTYKAIEDHLSKKQVTVITGMRRVGKTTAIRYLLDKIDHQNKLYLDLERIEYRHLFNQESYLDIERGLTQLGIRYY